LKTIRTGINVCSITPFNREGDLDEGALRAHYSRMATAGVGVFLPIIGTGESQLMRIDEIRRIWKIGVEELKGKVPVYVGGIGLNETRYMIDLANEAGATGADGVYLYGPRPLPAGRELPPAWIESYFREVLDRVKWPVLIADNTFIVGYSLPVEIVKAMVEGYDQVAGIIASDTDPTYIPRLLDAVGPDMPVVEVTPLPNLVKNLSRGAAGALSIEANVAPNLCAAVYSAFASGDISGAEAALSKVTRLYEVFSQYTNPTGVKAAVNLLGFAGGYARSPYHPPSEAALAEIAAVLDELEIRKVEGAA